MTDAPRFTAAEKEKCARRELGYRMRVYGGLVASGRMNANKARHEIALMQEIADDYRRQAQPDDLFPKWESSHDIVVPSD